MSKQQRMTDDEVMHHIRNDTLFNKARAQFHYGCGRIDQASAQRRPAGPVEIRRMEFEAVLKILDALGLELPKGSGR